MTDLKLQAETPTGYAVLAAELERIAAAIRDLPGAPSHMSVDIHAAPQDATRDQTIAEVDTVATAVFGKPGETELMSNGGYHHGAREWKRFGRRCSVNVNIYQALPKVDPKDAEIERLKAENAKLHAEQQRNAAARVDADYAPPSVRARHHHWLAAYRIAGDRESALAALHAEALAEDAERTEYAPAGRTTAVAEAKPDTLGVAMGHHGGSVPS